VTEVQIVRRPLPAIVALAVLAIAAAVLAAPAPGAKDRSCAERVVDDWYDNGRVDYVYPLKCYRQAIKILPPDVKDYSTAKEVIERALADATHRPRVTKPTPIEDVPCKKRERCIDPPSGGGAGGPGGSGSTGNGSGSAEPGDADTSGPSSVPVPLIVLGGLALLLLAAGSAGYLARRFGQGSDSGGEPPASA
jgi:hypothetical protein